MIPAWVTPAHETTAVMVAVGAACAVPGVFLVLRKMVLIADAMSHVLLLGIVLAYLLANDATSAWLYVGATASGVLTVALVEMLQRTKRLKEDAAISLVFPALFSIGVILSTLYLRNTHLDADRVLLGSVELAFLDRFTIRGTDCGPRSFVVLSICFVGMLAFTIAFYKELKLSTFDAGLATTLGFAPAILHYALMTSVSLTTVAAFDAVGPVLVLAFFAVPPLAARLLTNRLSRMLIFSVTFAIVGAITGTQLAFQLDSNIAGTVAGVLGVMFAFIWVFAPERGQIANVWREYQQRRRFRETMLAMHLHRHEGTPSEPEESLAAGLHLHLNWTEAETTATVERAIRHDLIASNREYLVLTETGRNRVAEMLNTLP